MSNSAPGWSWLESWVVILIAAHSFAIGWVLLFATDWVIDFGGWGGSVTPFFVRQGGAFHLVVATGYLVEYFRYRSVALLIIAKAVAVVFLLIMVLGGEVAWAVSLSAVADAAMLLAVIFLHRAARRA